MTTPVDPSGTSGSSDHPNPPATKAPPANTPAPGTGVHLGSFLVNTHFYGIVSDIDTPDAVTATMELLGDNAVVSLDALVGPRGKDGEDANPVRIEYDSTIDDPTQLPKDLTDEPADVGRAWWINNKLYVWSGTKYVVKAMGSPGVAGPVPNIDFSVDLIPLEEQAKGQQSWLEVSGTADNPSVRMHLAAPQGPRGENARITEASDYDNSTPIRKGDTLEWNGEKFFPISAQPQLPILYSIAQAAFINTITITKRQTIASITIPKQEFNYRIEPTGTVRVVGLQLDSTPVDIEVEVRVDDPNTGLLVGRGSGSPLAPAYIMPQYSSPNNPSAAISPDNSTAVLNGGIEHSVYVSLANGGTIGAYSFSRDYAGVLLKLWPIPGSQPMDPNNPNQGLQN